MVKLNSLNESVVSLIFMHSTQKVHNFDPKEIQQFAKLAKSWWDSQGPMKMLHAVNPIRTAYILDLVDLFGKKVLDIGCGAGLLSEAMARHGAEVLGIDLAQESIEIARAHAREEHLSPLPSYETISAEDLAEQKPGEFDIVTCMECLEHVPDPVSILRACARLLKPNGYIFLSTISRTPKAYLQAIIGAEYLLNLIPKQTHDYEKFIRPNELDSWARQQNLSLVNLKGIQYHPISKNFTLTQDVSVNYVACYQLKKD